MKYLISIFLIFVLISVPVWGETIIGLELYPDRMEDIFDNSNLANGEEWFATTVKVEKTLGRLTASFSIKTFLFGTNFFSYYPSSVKFTSSVSYQLTESIKIGFEHFCHHYFKQYPENLYSEQDRLTFEYSF